MRPVLAFHPEHWVLLLVALLLVVLFTQAVIGRRFFDLVRAFALAVLILWIVGFVLDDTTGGLLGGVR